MRRAFDNRLSVFLFSFFILFDALAVGVAVAALAANLCAARSVGAAVGRLRSWSCGGGRCTNVYRRTVVGTNYDGTVPRIG